MTVRNVRFRSRIIWSRAVGRPAAGLLLVAILAACGSDENGGGAGPVPSLPPSAAERIVYRADQDLDQVFELYLVGSGMKVNPSLPAGRSVTSFQLTPDKSAVVYLADQERDNIAELYYVPFANPGVSTKLNSPLATGPAAASTVVSFEVLPDGKGVVYKAGSSLGARFELYHVSFSTPGVSAKLNGPLVARGNVFSYEVAPDGQTLVYRADQEVEDVFELYRVRLVTPGVSTKLNGTLVAGGDVTDQYRITSDSSAVLYLADQDVDGQDELYRVAFDNPAVSVSLNAPLVGGGDVSAFAVTPDGTAVLYRADQDANDVVELYRVPVATPGASTKLNGVLATGGNVGSFQVTPDSQAVVYGGTQEAVDRNELYRVNLAAPGVSTKLNGPLGLTGDVVGYQVVPDGSAVIYRASLTPGGVAELYRVPFATPGVSTKLNGPLVSGGTVEPVFQITPDSSAVLYLADQRTNDITELQRVNISALGVSTTLNGPLVANGDVDSFAVR